MPCLWAASSAWMASPSSAWLTSCASHTTQTRWAGWAAAWAPWLRALTQYATQCSAAFTRRRAGVVTPHALLCPPSLPLRKGGPSGLLATRCGTHAVGLRPPCAPPAHGGAARAAGPAHGGRGWVGGWVCWCCCWVCAGVFVCDLRSQSRIRLHHHSLTCSLASISAVAARQATLQRLMDWTQVTILCNEWSIEHRRDAVEACLWPADSGSARWGMLHPSTPRTLPNSNSRPDCRPDP